MDFSDLVPEREIPTELGWLRSVTNFVAQECAAGSEWAKNYKAAKFKQDAYVKAFCDELRPFRYYADSIDLSDSTTFRLKGAGHRIDLSYLTDDAEVDLQITTSYSDVSVLYPQIALPMVGNAGLRYQQTLAEEVSRREGFASLTSIRQRDRNGRVSVLPGAQRMHTPTQLSLALASGLKAATANKMKPDYEDCELLVWHTAYEEYYNPDHHSILRQAWEHEFNGHFRAVHFMFAGSKVSVDINGALSGEC